MQTALIVTGIILVIFTVLVLVSRAKMKKIPLVADHNKIITLTNNNFQTLTKNRIVLVDFWASWCGPCRIMSPVLNEVSSQLNGNKHIGKVDIEKHEHLAKKYKVKSIPTLILFNNGKEVERYVGIKTKNFLLQQINKI
ncbi:MAG: thioredoxin [Bacteroidales bacterium]|nr:thioredoxin [Bacteroidales bacterium]